MRDDDLEPMSEMFPELRIDREPIPIGAAEALDLFRLLVRSAKELASDANRLLGHQRYARAAALAVLSFEEIGKMRPLARLVGVTEQKELNNRWRALFKHVEKSSSTSGIPPFVRDPEERATWEAARELFGKNLDAVKQAGFYTNRIVGKGWMGPEDVFRRNGLAQPEVVRSLVYFARTLADATDKWLRSTPDPIGMLVNDGPDDGADDLELSETAV